MRHERAPQYLLYWEMDLTARYDQNRLQRYYIRIYQVAEGSEGSDMVGFVKDLMIGALQKPTWQIKNI